nr:MAG TPA: hypothetical protein [Caudoviricetes sp.]
MSRRLFAVLTSARGEPTCARVISCWRSLTLEMALPRW